MSRTEKKCMIGSAAFHALLLIAVVVGSAFVSQKPKEVQVVPLFDMFNVKVTDFETTGGGGGGGTPQPLPPAQEPKPTPPAPTPKAKPPEPIKQEPVKEEPKPEPVKVEPPRQAKNTPKPKPIVKSDPKPDKPLPKNDSPDVVKVPEPPKKHVVKPQLDTKVIPDFKAEQAKADRVREEREERKRQLAQAREEQRRNFEQAVAKANERAAEAAQQTAAAFDQATSAIASKGAGASPISIPGPGSLAFVNYAQLVWSAYYQAWQPPNARGGNPTVAVEIVISREGRVVSAKIKRNSGDTSLDRSVKQALDRVQRLPAFPVGATDETRTFNLEFNLKAKRELG